MDVKCLFCVECTTLHGEMYETGTTFSFSFILDEERSSFNVSWFHIGYMQMPLEEKLREN